MLAQRKQQEGEQELQKQPEEAFPEVEEEEQVEDEEGFSSLELSESERSLDVSEEEVHRVASSMQSNEDADHHISLRRELADGVGFRRGGRRRRRRNE
jgi:hypothetical protein